jgi:predicted kinase
VKRPDSLTLLSAHSAHQPSLMLLIGLPGSGKTAFSRSVLADYPTARAVSTDAIRAQLFGDEAVQGPWRQVWQEVDRQLQVAIALIRLGEAAFALYDATNVVRRDRRCVLACVRELGFQQITGVWLNTPLEVCLARNRARDRQVPEAVMLRMARRLEGAPPSLSEALDHLVVVES